MYKKAFARRLKDNKYLIHLWEDEGYSKVEWINQAYIECHEADATHVGLLMLRTILFAFVLVVPELVVLLVK